MNKSDKNVYAKETSAKKRRYVAPTVTIIDTATSTAGGVEPGNENPQKKPLSV